ncbi:MAG: hydantoinase B/oxoprolinase family protein [Deltaproteobacteria bacterium]|nr:hydantoinase B/oxoprolinase family protein [Deltaproteobacteria bacterium]
MAVDRATLLAWIKPSPPSAEELAAAARLAPGDCEIYSEKLNAILDEAADVFVRTGVSSMLHSGDLVVGIYDPAGNMVAASCGVYMHAVTAQLPVKFVRSHFEGEPTVGIHEGDIFYCNDALYGGIHNPDQIAIMPIFHEGQLLAWSCAAVHQPETDAVEPGGMPGSAKSRHWEGMKLSPIKIGERYELRADLLEMMENFMSRAPRMQVVDVRARVTAADRIRRRVQDLAKAVGAPLLGGLFRKLIMQSEASARARVASWPDGTFRAVSFADTVGATESLVRAAITARKAGEKLTLDFTGTSPENEGPQNAFAHIAAAHMAIYLYAYAFHDLPVSAGTFAPLDFVVPDGCLLNAGSEAAVSQSVYACWQALTLTPIVFSKMMYASQQQSLVSGSAGNNHTVPFVYAGMNQWGGRVADLLGYPFNGEGLGARSDMDGVDCYGFPMAHTGLGPDVEDVETETFFLHLFQNELRDSGGPGKFRGGTGVESALVLYHVPRAVISSMGATTRVLIGQGLFGGYPPPAAPGIHVVGTDAIEKLGKGEPLPRDFRELAEKRQLGGQYRFERTTRASRMIGKGDLVSVIASGGSGYGDVLERDPARVARDVREQRVSPRAALDTYGVVLDAASGMPDDEATARKRAEIRQERLAHGKPWAEFLAEWSQRKPPEDMLACYGSWPDAKPVRPVMRL